MDNTAYKIADAARMAGVSASTLRLWEAQGLIDPVRTPSGQRLYDHHLVARLQKIVWLRSERGLNPAAIRAALSGEGETVSPSTMDHSAEVPIGQKIRRLRLELRQTLAAVGHATGLPVSILSTFERTSTGLSFTALHALAAHLGTTVAALSEQRIDGKESLIRAGDWKSLPRTSSGVSVQVLASGDLQMECHRFQLAAGASSEGAYQHVGEEFIHVLSGSLEIVLDGERFFELHPGDSFYFESNRPHSWRNTADGETLLLWINTPPTF
ncbi:MerR family transcriptional regulator [Rhizobium sp. CFBP 8762]|uniref:MerR family transcriptional regulator n=1 Tax=Rhizobium sp. CFBP 8762 TaxID=2775279 RepID=UPI00177FE735|nr:MerR family transcriptional regulator [Rhizobium sp. CFBP 8762]MBD8554569.1 MerR family transcriptional regulator [Rhizobium sp. CFBP 8762]